MADDKRPQAKKGSQSLRDYVRQTSRREAFGFYFQNNKVGWAVEQMALGKHDGQEVAIETSSSKMVLVIGEAKVTQSFEDRTIYELKGEGQVIWTESKMVENKVETTTTAVRKDDKLHITTHSEDEASKRVVGISKLTLTHLRDLERWLRAKRTLGDTFDSYDFDISEDKIDQKETYTYLQKKPGRWGGIATDIIHLKYRSENGISGVVQLLPDGTFLKINLGPIEMRREEEATAKNMKAAIASMTLDVAVKTKLGDPTKIDRLKLRLSGIDDFQIPTSLRQQLTKAKDGTQLLDIGRARQPDKKKALSEKDRAHYLRSTPSIQSDHKKIKQLAKEIVGSEKDPIKAADQLQKWVFVNLRASYKDNASTSLRVLKNRAGDCTEHTLLVVALARARGIPARTVGGLMYADDKSPAFVWHAWAEIHDGGRWVTVDAAWNQVDVDATHVCLSVGSDDLAWINLLTKLKMTVLEFESGK